MQFIIGCHQAVLEAASLNVAHAYIHSGKIAIERAIDEALRIESMRGLTKFQMERLQAVIDNTREGIIIFEKNSLYFSMPSLMTSYLVKVSGIGMLPWLHTLKVITMIRLYKSAILEFF